MKVTTAVELEDGEMRQAISEWISKHTGKKLTRFVGTVDKRTGQLTGVATTELPRFRVEVE